MTVACAHLTTDYLPRDAPRGYVHFSLEVDEGYVFHIRVLQAIGGKVQTLGQLRTGGMEVGDYKSITATAPPGAAQFFVEAAAFSGLQKDSPVPLAVNVVEDATTLVTVVLTKRYGGYGVTYRVGPPIPKSPHK